ncbi:hypothetical protein AB0M39_24350 [Streptomyces sp. NPDC051907]|uniref:hypothetical protein n=1 Tax=Streptomyces sp. NPDC051907 TaxID=3155284 RepID=UPI00342BCA99
MGCRTVTASGGAAPASGAPAGAAREPAPAALTGMRQALAYRDSRFVDFQDFDYPGGRGHGRRWVHIKRFRLPDGSPADRELLDALIAHPEFRDTYDGAGIWSEPRHGPWWSDRISSGTYQSVEASTALSTIDAWAAGGAPLPSDLDARLHAAVRTPVRRATSRYVLGALPDDAHHDYGPIHTAFHELVLVDRRTRSLALVVAADD